MIELTDNPHLGRFAGFPRDHLFSLIKGGSDFIDDYVKTQIDKYVKPDSICVDVGANLGYISIYLAKRCKHLYAVEPQPVVFLQLCCNLFLNECFNVTPLNLAATSCSCLLDFAPYQSGWVGTNDFTHYDRITSIGSISLKAHAQGSISGRRLDDVIKGPVNFIKIDAQGADIDVVLGARGLMEQYRPVIVFEYERDLSETNYGRTLSDLAPFLAQVGYRMETIHTDNYILLPNG